jgi:amino acid transporter
VALVVLSYREVVKVYTRAGGSYAVARENFGPRIAQVAAVALLIDYVVTVAVQTAAGSAAIVSAFPALGSHSLTVIAVVSVLIMCFGNLRGIREAGRTFAVPTYLFSGTAGLMIIVGLYREMLGGGLPRLPHQAGMYCTGCQSHASSGLLTFGALYILLRAFANGGSSLTGIEAVSNAVSALRPPEGRNARQILITQGSIVAFLIGGISWLAHVTHAAPYVTGVPTVIAQEASLVFGHTMGGRALFFLVQAGTAAILFTGGNTSFSGFPFLASFVAEDSFLPRWLTKRGHRLAFSNGIIVLTVVSLALLIGVGARVNSLVPFYAIGVFTGFSMAGFGMARYHLVHREQGWRHRLAINLAGGSYTALVVAIFAVVKFTEGAWLIVIVFPLLVFGLIRLNRQYRMEAEVVENLTSHKPKDLPNFTRRPVLLFVDGFDLAALAALRYARSLRPTSLRAVHFVLDREKAGKLREQWLRFGRHVPLDLVDCADRRITRAAADLAAREAAEPGTYVTVVLPRRSYSPLLGRFLHDRTADKIARMVSRIPRCAATIIPFDVGARVEVLHERQAGQPAKAAGNGKAMAAGAKVREHEHPPVPPGGTPISSLTNAARATVRGRVRSMEIRPLPGSCVLAATVADATGELTALFYGRTSIPGLEPGSMVLLRGPVGRHDGSTLMANPAYELL